MVGEAVKGHAVKIALPEKARRKTAFRRPIINLLCDDFQRALRVLIENFILVLLAAAFGIGAIQHTSHGETYFLTQSMDLCENASHDETHLAEIMPDGSRKIRAYRHRRIV